MATKSVTASLIFVVTLFTVAVILAHPTERTKTKKFKNFQDKGRTWQDALDHCTSLSMKLATINSKQEQKAVEDLISGLPHWLGGSDLGDTGNYTWRSTNSKITYSNWESGQPNNLKDPDLIDAEEDHCIAISSTRNKWFDDGCNSRLYHLCEYEE